MALDVCCVFCTVKILGARKPGPFATVVPVLSYCGERIKTLVLSLSKSLAERIIPKYSDWCAAYYWFWLVSSQLYWRITKCFVMLPSLWRFSSIFHCEFYILYRLYVKLAQYMFRNGSWWLSSVSLHEYEKYMSFLVSLAFVTVSRFVSGH